MQHQLEADFLDFAKSREARFDEDLSQLRGYKIAIDANLLLSKVRECSALKSIQEGYSCLDLHVQNSIERILQNLKTKYDISVHVVIDGLRPACASSETNSLVKSRAIWQEIDKSGADSTSAATNPVFQKILQEYGSRFYMQEIINATKKVSDCHFFVAPYNASAQLAQFFKDELVHVVFGSAKLLCYEHIGQAIVDLDNQKGTFSFIDRDDLKLEGNSCENLADFFVASGGMYGLRYSTQKTEELLKMLPSEAKKINETISSERKDLCAALRNVLYDAPPVLSMKRELRVLDGSPKKAPSPENLGYLMNDDIYFCLSQGLLEARTLELVTNRSTTHEILLAPSFLIKELWDIQPTSQDETSRHFGQFLGLSLSNLLEREGKDSEKFWSSPASEGIRKFLKEKHLFQTATASHCTSKWNISDENIENEQDRAESNSISFYFILRWLQFEQKSLGQASGSQDSKLLTGMGGSDASSKRLRSINELLAMCYFQYLESNHFLSANKTYLYGQLLENCNEFEETFLVVLEMLRLYFPAGMPLDCPTSHLEFLKKHGLMHQIAPSPSSSLQSDEDRASVILLSRVFSLLPAPKMSAKDTPKSSSLQKESLDFDLALFTTYAQSLKSHMRFVFQTILYRLFRQDRLAIDVPLFQQAVDQLAFSKQNSSVLGLVMRSALLRPSLDKPYSGGFQGTIFEEFNIEQKHFDAYLKQCVKFWSRFLSIISILELSKAIPLELSDQLQSANNFLKKRLESLRQTELLDLLNSA